MMKKKFPSKVIAKAVENAEALHQSQVITFQDHYGDPKVPHKPGGMCSCCGAGPRVTDEHDWCLIMKGGLTDSDGVFYSMLCAFPEGSGCLPDLRAENARRKTTFRDEAAEVVADLLGDDVDGMEAMMDDLGARDDPESPGPRGLRVHTRPRDGAVRPGVVLRRSAATCS